MFDRRVTRSARRLRATYVSGTVHKLLEQTADRSARDFARRDDAVDQGAAPVNPSRLFQSFFLGGFECSTHRRKRDRRRLDLIAATGHDVRAAEDYRLLASYRIRSVRDGVRWHLIEKRPGQYDFSSFLPMLRAASETGTQVIWDLLHYGWPDHYDIWSPEFIAAFRRFVTATAELVRSETDAVPFWTPVNEISFWAWAGGDKKFLNPFAERRGHRLKVILAQAAIAAIQSVREVDPRARVASAEPLIWVLPKSRRARDIRTAQEYTNAQFEALDLISGRLRPDLGGRPEYLDILGLNYYLKNQWVDGEVPIYPGDPNYRPLRELLAMVYERYRRPIFLAETGTEGGGRAPWLHYVGDEVAGARAEGVPVEGICLYPILNHPGWDNDRLCPNGLFCGGTPHGERTVFRPLAEEIARQQTMFERGWHYID